MTFKSFGSFLEQQLMFMVYGIVLLELMHICSRFHHLERSIKKCSPKW